MKLASLNDGSLDGQLVVVDKLLKKAVVVSKIAPTLQYALDYWSDCEGALREIYQQLNAGSIKTVIDFIPQKVYSPLPRAYQWVDGSAYVNHVELVRKARGVELPTKFWTDPLMYQGCSDSFLAPTADIQMADVEYGIDFEAEIAMITKRVPMGVSADKAGDYIALCMLVNDVSLRNLIPEELEKGFGFLQSKPASSFSPVAVTLDELGAAWDHKKVHLPLMSYLNNKLFGQPNAGIDMTFDFPTLIAHAAKTRFLAAGTILGSGTVSNLDRSTGSSCIVEKRMLEIIAGGKPITPYMQFGDRVRIEMLDTDGNSIFGAIDQKVVKYQ